ncbi:MAG: Fic family protein [Planctomycetaceae bacterium]
MPKVSRKATSRRSSGYSPKFQITNAIAKALTIIERARGFLQAATLSEQWVTSMSDRALLLEAHHTTHIEGTQLTLEQSEKLLAGKQVYGVSRDDRRELLNYRDAFELVSRYILSDSPITETLIREIHRLLVLGVRDGEARPGEYRRVQNLVANTETGKIIYTSPPKDDVPELMRQLIVWLNHETDIHPVLVSGLAQFQLVHIHPFVDGNGRTSRLLSTLCLYRTGYDFKRLFTLSEFYDRDRRAYYHAIQQVRDSGMNCTGWLEYYCNGLAAQMNETVDRGRKVIRTDVLSREHDLNARQAFVLQSLMDGMRIRISDLESQFPHTNRRTLQRDLKRLADLALIEHSAGSATDPNREYSLREL